MSRFDMRLGGQLFSVEVLNLPAPGKDQDAWRVQDDFVAVADGATPLSGDNPGVRSFAEDALGALAAGAAAPARELFAKAVLQTRWESNSDLPSCTIGILRTTEAGLEIDVLGDCLIVATGTEIEPVVVRDDRVHMFDQQVVARIEALLDQGASVEDALESVQPLLQANRAKMNRDDTYWSFAGDLTAAEQVTTHGLQADSLDAALLCTDGFAHLSETFHLYAGPVALLDAAMTVGLAHLGRQLRAAESATASMRRHPRLAIHDDATAVLVRAQ